MYFIQYCGKNTDEVFRPAPGRGGFLDKSKAGERSKHAKKGVRTKGNDSFITQQPHHECQRDSQDLYGVAYFCIFDGKNNYVCM